jgi:membrane protease YdiL (CAAX protease family)
MLGTDPTICLLLIAALGSYACLLRGGLGARGRMHRYRMQAARSLLLLALPTLVALALLGRLEALAVLPAEFVPLAAQFGEAPDPGFYVLAAGGGMIAGIALLRLRPRLAAIRVGAVAGLLPRDRSERAHAALLALAAGIAEELYFRLLLPLLIAMLTGNAALGFTLATAGFALAHRYQGWAGMLASAVLGALFAALYLATGALWAAIIVHVALDLATLVLRPAESRRI